MIELYVQPIENRILVEPKDVYNFTWEVVYFEYNFMYIQLNFTHPGYISTVNMNLDSLIWKVKPEWSHLFFSKFINKELDPGWYNLTHEIPRQELSADRYYFNARLIAKIFKILI